MVFYQYEAGSTVTYFAYDSSGQLIGMSAGSSRYYYVRNAQNDITGIIDTNGTLVVQYRYDAWGKPVSTIGSRASTIGKRNLATTGTKRQACTTSEAGTTIPRSEGSSARMI